MSFTVSLQWPWPEPRYLNSNFSANVTSLSSPILILYLFIYLFSADLLANQHPDEEVEEMGKGNKNHRLSVLSRLVQLICRKN